jgi:DnaJ-class molecular chaperone
LHMAVSLRTDLQSWATAGSPCTGVLKTIDPMSTHKQHYQTLGIPKDASAEQIKGAYRSHVKACHPDQFPSGSEAHAVAEERIREVNAAYAVLSNPRKRASYDSKLHKKASSRPEPEPQHCGQCGKPTGHWHTDTNVALCHACVGTAT